MGGLMSDYLSISQAQAQRHLALLDEEAEFFTFQTFDDNKARKDQKLARILHGSLEDKLPELTRLSAAGAGIFVTVNETDLKGRTKENITRIRAVFKEDDRGGTPPLPLEPQLIIESSPGKYHEYIITDAKGVDVAEFRPVQQRLVDDYGSDPSAKDLPRVLRLAGFPHQKNPEKPHIARISSDSGEPPYSWDEVTKAFPPVAQSLHDMLKLQPGRFAQEEISSALTALDPDCDYESWLKIGMAIHHASKGSLDGFDMWDSWSVKGSSYRDNETASKWHSFGQYNDSQVTIKSLFDLAYKAKWQGVQLSREDLLQRVEDAEDTDIDRAMEINALIKASKLPHQEAGIIRKALKKKFGINIGDMVKDVSTDAGSSPGDVELADETLASMGDEEILHGATGHFYKWRKTGVWERLDENFLRQKIQNVCDASKHTYNSALIDSTLKIIRNRTHRPGVVFDDANDAINCKSGAMRFEKEQWVLKPHDKSDYRSTQIPHAYDPDAKSPRFNLFLDEIFAGDSDIEQKKTVVLELLGYSMLGSCEFEKFAMLIGGGANGKSVLLKVVSQLLGHRSITAVQPSSFKNNFQMGHLHGKLANVVSELKEGAEIEDAKLKAIVSGELVTAEHKGITPFDFNPVATCWFGTNHMPHSRDFSEALFRRAIILKFNNSFLGTAGDKHLHKKLLAEMPGVFAQSLKAVGEVIKRGGFTECPSSEAAKEDWRTEIDQARQFVNECCYAEEGAIVPFKEIYAAYTAWTRDSGIKSPLNKNNLGGRLGRMGFELKRTNTTRFRIGLKLITDKYSGFPTSVITPTLSKDEKTRNIT
ncbi:MAG TPA: hypothetical protein EYQ00_15770 [Dehalococcoidia bacterium]|nr:hypothetical protein [Dehalococcoidia bacterium]